MSGTSIGWVKARQTMIERMGGLEAFKRSRQEIGAVGGRISRGGGFGSGEVGKDGLTGKARAKIAGAIGGAKSRRGSEDSR